MGGCSVPLCSNRSEDGIKMRKNPNDMNRLLKWQDYLRKYGYKKQFPKNFFICEVHFDVKVLNDGSTEPEKDPSVPREIWLQVNI